MESRKLSMQVMQKVLTTKNLLPFLDPLFHFGTPVIQFQGSILFSVNYIFTSSTGVSASLSNTWSSFPIFSSNEINGHSVWSLRIGFNSAIKTPSRQLHTLDNRQL